MACRLVGAKPLSELMLLMLDYCQLEPEEHTSVKSLFKENAFKNWRLRNGVHSVSASIS